ncbi:MAG: thiamine-phosphate kinase [Hyphomicrobium sp.]|nr:thiamine-phosphate kinase [Hyphomicrobium sp.]
MSGSITSEEELIRTYLAPLARANEGAFGLRDDCAIFSPTPGTDLVISTDAIAAGVHFFPDDRPEDIAWKALAVNLSDLAASAATPRVYQMALSFPEAPAHAFMQRFASGLADAQSAFGIVLSGGDTDRRPGPMTVTITAIGDVPAGFRLTRDGARAGDALFVTGTLGDAACGLKLRRGDEDARNWPFEANERTDLIARYLRPQPRLDIAPLLRRVATAAMDLSDGLAKDLGRLAGACSAGAVIERARLPVSTAVRRLAGADSSIEQLVLSGGDDYELLFAAPREHEAEIRTWAATAGTNVTRIGWIAETPGLLLRTNDCDRPLVPAGWEHF